MFVIVGCIWLILCYEERGQLCLGTCPYDKNVIDETFPYVNVIPVNVL